MKKLLLLSLSALLLFSSCSKDKDKTPVEETTVEISGTRYPVIKVGTQTWTTVNYNGPGGFNYGGGNTNDAAYGKLYSLTEAKAVTLPKGWRLPTRTDLQNLVKAAGGTINSQGDVEINATSIGKFKSKTGWELSNGDNALGLNILPAGTALVITPTTNEYVYKGLETFLWSSSGTSAEPYVMSIQTMANPLNQSVINQLNIYSIISPEALKCSIRFVKDN